MKRKHSYLFPALLSLLLAVSACKRMPDRPRVVGEIKSVAQLATLEAVLTKVVIGNRQKKLLMGLITPRDASFLAHTEATVKVGIDLHKLREEHIRITENRISLTLPPIELINFSYPAEKFSPDRYYSDDNSWWNDFTFDEKDALFREAEISIINSIPYLGITETAEERTRQLMTGLLKRMGFEEIYIEFAQQPLPVATKSLP